jgi:23S rRNA G2445 N2-methylase RlmL
MGHFTDGGAAGGAYYNSGAAPADDDDAFAAPRRQQQQQQQRQQRQQQGGAWAPVVQRWPDFDGGAWLAAFEAAAAEARPSAPVPLLANDWHEGALSLAHGDAQRAGVDHCIQVGTCAFAACAVVL